MNRRFKSLSHLWTREIRQWAPFSCLALCTVACLLLLSSSCTSTGSRQVIVPPQVEGAHFVGNEKCEDCHQEITRHFPGSVHSRFFKDTKDYHGVSGCESCHGPGSKHIQAGGGQNVFIHNPGKNPQSCLECHQEKHAEFSLPMHHPVLEGQMNCVDCHDPHGRDIFKQPSGLALARQDQQCAQCHREQTRPFVFVHEGMQDGCTTCHQPHGSINDKMLTQRDSNLCLRCHSQMQFDPTQVLVGKTDHRAFLSMGTCWTAGCHTAVHGSMVNPRLLY